MSKYLKFRSNIDQGIYELLVKFGTHLVQQNNLTESDVPDIIRQWDSTFESFDIKPKLKPPKTDYLNFPSPSISKHARQNIAPSVYESIEEEKKATICNWFDSTKKTYCGAFPVKDNNRCQYCKNKSADSKTETKQSTGIVNPKTIEDGLSVKPKIKGGVPLGGKVKTKSSENIETPSAETFSSQPSVSAEGTLTDKIKVCFIATNLENIYMTNKSHINDVLFRKEGGKYIAFACLDGIKCSSNDVTPEIPEDWDSKKKKFPVFKQRKLEQIEGVEFKDDTVPISDL